jgi:coenzyme F420-reducing hydrogenase beta subunit
MPDPTTTNLTSDGIPFIRTGTCNMCGYCCIKCPHLSGTEGSYICLIHDALDKFCDTCKQTHADCITYPRTPFLQCIKDKKCSFAFELKNSKDTATFTALNSKW